MTKFKIGDKVKLISNRACSMNKVGDVGIVTELNLNEAGCRVQVEGGWTCANQSYFDDLKLVETE